MVFRRHHVRSPWWCPKDTEVVSEGSQGDVLKIRKAVSQRTPTRLETILENNTRETTTTPAVSSSSFSPREMILDHRVSELVAEAYQVFDGALPIESTVEQWALVAQESRDAAGEELGEEAFAGYCQLAARTTPMPISIVSGGDVFWTYSGRFCLGLDGVRAKVTATISRIRSFDGGQAP